MTQLTLFALLGLGAGALIAGVALSVVLTYRGSGIINLAAGAVAMVAAYTFWALRSDFFHITLATGPAFVATVLVAVVLGALMEFLVFRPLRTAAPLAKLIASLGILLALQATMLLVFGTAAKPIPNILPKDNVELLGVSVPVNRFWMAGIVVVITVVLMGFYRWTRFGLSTRAASENEVVAMLMGLSPNQLSLVNTVLASAIAGIVGIVSAPLVQADSITLPLVIAPALAAALFARFTSFGIATIAGLLIGVGQSIMYYVTTLSWFPKIKGSPMPGVQALLTFLILVVAMFVRGASLPSRGELVEKRLPAAPRPRHVLRPSLALAALGAVLLVVLPYGYRQALMLSLIGSVVCLSFVVITGYVGQVSLIQVPLAGVCGFTVFHLTADAGIGFPWGPLIGSVASVVVGMLVGASALRVRGVSLAVVTIAGVVAIEQFGFSNEKWGARTAGSPVEQPRLFGIDLGSNAGFRGLDNKVPSPVLGFMFLVVLVALALLVAATRRSTLGQQMLAIRSNERAAAASGVSVTRVKFLAYGISSFIAGTAGWMYAYNFGSINAARFGFLIALSFVAFAYIGGITMVSGAILGGLFASEGLLPHTVEDVFDISGRWTLLVGGLLLIVTLIQNPEGVAGTVYRKGMLRRKSESRAESPAPAIARAS